ncbi:MAG: tail fiber domain-containing protein [Cytophagales bacterium]
MRKLYVSILLMASVCAVNAQNNVGIGTTTASPNAILHLENGTSDLGLLLPNVETAGFTPLVSDEGLMVYDSVLNLIFTWDGSAWQPAGGTISLQSAYDGGQLVNMNSGNIDFQSSAANPVLYLDEANERVGIGTATPGAQFEVSQEIVVNGIEIGRGFNNDNRSTGLGIRTLDVTNLGAANTAIGYEAGWQMTNGTDNVALGSQSLTLNTTGSRNTAVGGFALFNNLTGSDNTAIGALSDVAVDGLTNATVIGANATVGASNSLVLGNNANVGIGTSTPSNKLEVIGDAAKFDSVIIVNNAQAGYVLTAADASGAASWQPGGAGTSWDLLGNSATIDGVNFIGTSDNVPLSFRINNQASGRIGNNTTSSTALGFNALALNTNSENTAFGSNAAGLNTTGFRNTAIGSGAMQSNIIGNSNVAVGNIALRDNIADENTAVGRGAMAQNTTGSANVAVGFLASDNNTGSSNNTAVGHAALTNSVGSDNTSIGKSSMLFNGGGSQNVAVGVLSMQTNTFGNSNTTIGYLADVGAAGLNNATAIGANAIVGASNALVLGNNANVGIGISSPLSALQIENTLSFFNAVAGIDVISHNISDDGVGGGNLIQNGGASSILMRDTAVEFYTWPVGTAGDPIAVFSNKVSIQPSGMVIGGDNPSEILDVRGPVLLEDQGVAPATTTDRLYNVAGDVFWNGTNLTSGGSGWGLLGNAGTIDGTNFIGTTDNIPLNFRVNNVPAGRIDHIQFNAAFGRSTLQSNTAGTHNTAVGNNAMIVNSTGSRNAAFGSQALQNGNSDDNAAIGFRSLMASSGGRNTALGYQTGNTITTGNSNTFIGYDADATVNNLNNATAIGANASVAISNALVLGNNANVGIGTSSPNAPLQFATALANRKIVLFEGANNDHQYFGFGVNGAALRYQINGTFASHIFYASVNTTTSNELMRIVGDGNVGIGVTVPTERLHISSSAGSTGMIITNDFLGTTATDGLLIGISGSNTATINNRENGSLLLGTNGLPNINQLVLDPSGNVGIDITPPTERLHINGNLRFSGAIMPNNDPGSAGDVLTSAGPGSPPTWGTISGFTTAGNGLSSSGNTVDLGGTVTLGETVFNSANDLLFRIESSNSALDTKAGLKLRMFDSSVQDQWEVIARKSDATANSGQSHFIINKQFSTAGGQLDAITIDGDNSNVIINNAKTTASPYGDFIVLNGEVGIGTIAPGSNKLSVITQSTNGAAGYFENNIGSGIDGSALRVVNSGVRSIGHNAALIQNLVTKVGGSNSTKTGLKIESTGAWGIATVNQPNIGLDVTVSGADDNYAAIFNGGNVGIGTNAPFRKLDVIGGNGIGIEPQAGGENFITFVNSNDGNPAWGINDGWTVNRDFRLYRYNNAGAFLDIPFAIDNSSGNIGIANTDIQLRGLTDTNHGLGWYGLGKLWNGQNIDGPVLYGNEGGMLGINNLGTPIDRLRWSLTGVTVYGVFTNLSDERVKNNISEIDYGLSEVMALNPVKYDWKKGFGEGTSLGFLAQEVLKVAPEIVELPENSAEFLSMSYIELIPILVKSIQEQQMIIESQQNQIENLKVQNTKAIKSDENVQNKLNLLQVQIDQLNAILSMEAKK